MFLPREYKSAFASIAREGRMRNRMSGAIRIYGVTTAAP